MNSKGRYSLFYYWNHFWEDSILIRKEGILQKIAILGSGSALAQALTALYAILLARHLKPEAYGVFTATYTTVALSSVLYNCGLDTWLLRHAVITEKPQILLGRVYILKATFGIAWGGAIYLILPLLRQSIFNPTLLLVAILDIWLDGFFNADIAMLNALRRSQWASLLLLVSRGSRLTFAILLILFDSQSPLFFAFGRMSGTSLALALSLLITSPKMDGCNLNSLKAIVTDSFAYGVSDFLSAIYLQADVTILAILSGKSRDVGVYAPASSLINALFILPAAVFSVMVPNLTSLYQNREERFHQVIRWTFVGFGILGILLWISVGLGSNLLVTALLGEAYLITARLLAILSPLLLLKSINFACAALLVAVGLQRQRIVPQGVSALTNVVLNLILIAPYGVWGVAYAYLASEALLLTGYLTYAIKWYRINR